jgi:16S rRNA G527 N7-methylase RsmG
MTDDTRLLSALAVVQTRGAIGERSLVDAVAHADRFVALIPLGPHSLIDLGSGGGLPALVIAWRRRDLSVTMVERRATRADMLRRAISSLGLGEHASVINLDVEDVCAQACTFDVVTARSFGEVAVTTRFVDRLLHSGGLALISEPPVDRSGQWAAVLADYPALLDGGVDLGIRRIRRSSGDGCFT